MLQKTTQLKNLLSSGQTEFILEAHNGLSARIVEEAGFKGIWGSGLALSAQHAVRDNNELSWTQVGSTGVHDRCYRYTDFARWRYRLW